MSIQAIEQEQQRQFRPLHICITGSSQGIGLAAARYLISQGHVVYHACRNAERAAAAVQAAGGGIPLVCDLNDFYSIQRFARTLEIRAPQLDVLCLNAGVAPSTTSQKPLLTDQGYERCIGVNHLGHFLLAHLLLKKLCSGGCGRLVITSSSVHDPDTKAGQSGTGGGADLGDLSGLGVNLKECPSASSMVNGSLEYSGAKVYKDSKLCNILMCLAMARKFANTNFLCVVAFNPGLVPSTGLFQSLRDENWMRATLLTSAAWLFGFSVPLDVAGRRLAHLATCPSLTAASGSYYSAPTKSRGTTPETGFLPTQPSKDALNTDLQDRLWEKSLFIVRDWLQ